MIQGEFGDDDELLFPIELINVATTHKDDHPSSKLDYAIT
jgi:hypothetical protein